VGLETKENRGAKITKQKPGRDERPTAGNHGQEKKSTIHPWAASITTAFKKEGWISTLPNRPDTHDVDYFFQSYRKWWSHDQIWLVLALGKGATLELKKMPPCRLTLTNENILAVLLALGGQSYAPRVRLLYLKLQRHQNHYFVLSEGNLRLLLKTMVTRYFDVGKDIVLDLREVFCHEEQTILSDTARRELQIIRQALFPSRRIHFEVCGRDGPCWWIKSIESVQHFCHLVFPSSSTTTTAQRATGFVFSYSSVAEKDWVQWCTAQQHLLRWLKAHQPGVPVLLKFSYHCKPTTTLNFSGVQLECYLHSAPWEEEEEKEYVIGDGLFRITHRCSCEWRHGSLSNSIFNKNEIRSNSVKRPCRCCSTYKTLSLRHFGLQDEDMEWICRGLATRVGGGGRYHSRTNSHGKTLDLTGNAVITGQGWWTLLCYAVSSRTTMEVVIQSSPDSSSSGTNWSAYQSYFHYVRHCNRNHRWLMDTLLLIYPDARELTSLLFADPGPGMWFQKSNAVLDVLYLSLRHDSARWAPQKRLRAPGMVQQKVRR
jgi:hypothetical protein